MIILRHTLASALMARVVLTNAQLTASNSWKRGFVASSIARPMGSCSSVRSFVTCGTCQKDADHDALHANSSGSMKLPDDPKLVTNEEWAKKLKSEQYFCAREGGTESPFSGKYVHHKGEGIYTCVCCETDLFSSDAKYDSGSGWPSFYAALNDAASDSSNVIRRKDLSHGMVRTELLCKNCNAHLGHVFEDGPQPTGERFCVNSASLKFQPKKLH